MQKPLNPHNAHKYTFAHAQIPPQTPHTKQDSLELQLGVTWTTLLLSSPQPWERACSRGKRGRINWRHRARECDYSGLVCKVATGLCSIPSPHVALCLGWVAAIHWGLVWLSSTELPAWNWAALQATAAAHGELLNSHAHSFYLYRQVLRLSRPDTQRLASPVTQ